MTITGAPSAAILFQSYPITTDVQDQGRMISFTQGWVGIGVYVASVAGAGAGCSLKVQWSVNGSVWTDDPGGAFAAPSAPGTYTCQVQVRGLFWRLAASGVVGTLTATAGAIY